MSTLSPDATAHVVPVVQIIIALVVGLVAIVGSLWAGFRWLRSQIRDEFHGLTGSKEFKLVVSDIINDATAGWNDINNRQHEEHRRAISDLRNRDNERADAIKRLHGRVDAVWEKVPRG